MAHNKFEMWIRIRAIGILLALGASAAWAQSCFQKCQNSCKNMSGIVDQACVDRCNSAYCEGNRNTTPHPYGAIAFELIHAWEGISWGKATQAEADRAALARCAEHGKNCKIVYRFHNTCAALAIAKGREHYVSATGKTEKEAEANATAECRKSFSVCGTNMSACSP